MRINSLTLRLYVFSIGTVLATVGMVLATAFALRAEHAQVMTLASGQVARSLWLRRESSRATQSALDANAGPAGALVTFYDTSGRLVASTAKPPLPMPSRTALAALTERGAVDVDHGVFAHEVSSNGRVAAIAVVKLGGVPSVSRLAQYFLVLFAVLLGGAVLFARQLARPLQHVAMIARRFGRGDLAARVRSTKNDDIGDVGRAFDKMADRVAGLMAAQQELMANVSHELRTPLSRIQVAVDLIADGKAEQARDLTPDIAQDLAELERLIDDVMVVAKLDLSRSAEGSVVPLRLEAVRMSALVNDAISRFRALHPARELAVELARGLPELRVDSVLLRRAIDNLLENAHKFSDGATRIRLSAFSTSAGVTISVTDQGIGIDEMEMQNVCTPFFRSDKSRSRSTGGSGLGLALAKRVIEAHRGTIGITSNPGQGTTVTLTLPPASAAELGRDLTS